MVFALFLGVFTGSPQGAVHSCEDGLDNDGDGLIDALDADCLMSGPGFPSENGWNVCPFGVGCGSFPFGFQCADGLDNDGDGWIDHEDSVFNENALAPSCDNNGDLTE
jgi:hypothetical protein